MIGSANFFPNRQTKCASHTPQRSPCGRQVHSEAVECPWCAVPACKSDATFAPNAAFIVWCISVGEKPPKCLFLGDPCSHLTHGSHPSLHLKLRQSGQPFSATRWRLCLCLIIRRDMSPKLFLSLGIWAPTYYMVPWGHPSPQLKWQLDWFTHFCGAHCCV